MKKQSSLVLMIIVIAASLLPGACGSGGGGGTPSVANLFFYRATDGVHGFELWRSDGTAEGTYMVRNSTPGADGGGAENITISGGRLFYTAYTEAEGDELWTSNGTEAGTGLVKDIWPGVDGSFPSWLADSGGVLYFSADDGTGGRELWKSNGASAGTSLVKDIYPGTGDYGINDGNPFGMISIGSTLYFTAHDADTGFELWKSNGTADGTSLVKDVNPGTANGMPTGMVAGGGRQIITINGALYLAANDGATGMELWKSDGIGEGTARIKDIYTGAAGSDPRSFTAVGGILYFTADDGIYGRELWSLNTVISPLEPKLVKDINSAAATSSNPRYLTPAGSRLFFIANDGTGNALWTSAGTTDSTLKVKNINVSFGMIPVYQSVAVKDSLFFFDTDGGTGYALWVSDGTQTGTAQITAWQTAPSGLGSRNGLLFFFADDGIHGYELWTSDGTVDGTYMVRDACPGACSCISVS